MVDLKAKPYCLQEEDIQWVNDTIRGMNNEEKVGQLFFQLTAGIGEDYLKELMEKYHLGGCRFNKMPGIAVQNQNRILQKYAKVPVFIACNTENGGGGACANGTFIGSGIKIGATGKAEHAYNLGKFANTEAKVLGCNMAFAPVCDIHYNWQNQEVINRAFGNDVDRVAEMSKAYMDGLHTIEGFACVAKHFPGNGQDFRDAHLSNNINNFDEETWMNTYGKVYKTLFDGGLDGVMGGHIMMPAYMRENYPDIRDEEMLPATLCKEIMTGLLRDKLGFNGIVVTDASHMAAMTNRMTRKEMLPKCINAGCDMFLFFNDPEEDFRTMLEAYEQGIIPEERMEAALSRILGLKAKMGLHRLAKEELVPAPEAMSIIGCQAHKDAACAISDDGITLVKYLDEGVLPITPEKYKRIMIVDIKGDPSPMEFMMKAIMAQQGIIKKTPAEDLRDRLIEKGFDAFVYVSPLDKMKEQVERGEKPNMNLYFAGKNAIADFTAGQDLVISLCNVVNGRPSFGLSKGGGELPWYVFELPVIGISVNMPTMLADLPMLRTYINAYDSEACTMEKLVDKLLEGPEAFKGKDPIDSFCGLFDARI